MASILLLLLLTPIFGCMFVVAAKPGGNNAFKVTLLTLSTNIILILRMLSQLDTHILRRQFLLHYDWLKSPDITLSFGVDLFSLVILLGAYTAVIIGATGLSKEQRGNKSLLLMALYFMFNLTGFLTAIDVFSFYTFFAGMLVPFLIMAGNSGSKKTSGSYLFFVFHLLGGFCMLAVLLAVCKAYGGTIGLADISARLPKRLSFIIWAGSCLAFISRLPIWPFHYWTSSINADSKNSLLYTVTDLMPLTGLYGMMRFWQITVPKSILPFVPVIETIAVMTMLLVALTGSAHKNFLPKLQSYNTVICLLLLLSGVLLPDSYYMNIAYSLFTFLLVTSSLIVLDFKAEEVVSAKGCEYRGILAYMPRLSNIFAFFVLVAVGLPISSMFWNNFVLISALFRENFYIGIGIMIAILIVGLSLVYELFMMRNHIAHTTTANEEIDDISDRLLSFFMMIIIILFLSFFKPLWFVF